MPSDLKARVVSSVTAVMATVTLCNKAPAPPVRPFLRTEHSLYPAGVKSVLT